MSWIKIEDKVPPKAGYYLVVAEWMGIIEKGEFDGHSRWTLNNNFDPTHWMYLPQPPKNEGNNEIFYDNIIRSVRY